MDTEEFTAALGRDVLVDEGNVSVLFFDEEEEGREEEELGMVDPFGGCSGEEEVFFAATT